MPGFARRKAVMMSRSNQSSELEFVVTNTLIVRDIQRSVAFYRDVLGATALRQGQILSAIALSIKLGRFGRTDQH
jgi:catechol-2,3-dioxygenase